MRGGYYLFWHPEQNDRIQIIQAMNLTMAMGMVSLIRDKKLQHHAFQDYRPDELDIVAAIKGDINKAELSLDAYHKTDSEKKPIQRAQEAFRKTFGRQAKTADLWWEAKALSVIVKRWKEREGIEEEFDVGSPDSDGDNSGRIVSLAGTARISRDPVRKYPRRRR